MKPSKPFRQIGESHGASEPAGSGAYQPDQCGFTKRLEAGFEFRTACGRVTGVFEINESDMVLTELAPELSIEEVQAATEATLLVSPNLRSMQLSAC
ncbi:hypothetical protein RN22_18915 [Grimontia sp. AD028]|nr:hypothetical protein RN22_18915 [Grimontia sp. AD028]